MPVLPDTLRQQHTVYFAKEHVSALIKLGEERDRSMSYLVGQAVASWLSRGAPNVRREAQEVQK